ncbi:hypothetical protein N7495_001747 [Penicillium taxi]|uniref:uncharacterized protein n=1 Tax=Penicillium taxi TaxID=168475 RepID=UPI0025454A89|nr:uncharacterized protein N7495_001747 [Penicillium taxi]KAJ5909065.1 hypothetical protein N7495_001747 [Penicillium taxi]
MYENLSEYQRKQIPRFYGSFSLDLPFRGETRTVRLILIEYIPGISMDQANPEDFSQETRKQIMKLVINLKSEIYGLKNILLYDLHPRNIMIQEGPDVVLIDFADAMTNRGTGFYPWQQTTSSMAPYMGEYVLPQLRWKNLDEPFRSRRSF